MYIYMYDYVHVYMYAMYMYMYTMSTLWKIDEKHTYMISRHISIIRREQTWPKTTENGASQKFPQFTILFPANNYARFPTIV